MKCPSGEFSLENILSLLRFKKLCLVGFAICLSIVSVFITVLVSNWYRQKLINIHVYDPALWRALEASDATGGLIESTDDIKIDESLLESDASLPEAELPNDVTGGQALTVTLAEVVRSGKHAARTQFQNKDRIKDVHDHLDLTSFRSSIGPMHIASISEYTSTIPSTVSTTACSLIIDNDDWSYRFDIVASGDFDNDSQEDLLAILRDRSKLGSYNATSILLLSRHQRNIIIARDIPVSLRRQEKD